MRRLFLGATALVGVAGCAAILGDQFNVSAGGGENEDAGSVDSGDAAGDGALGDGPLADALADAGSMADAHVLACAVDPTFPQKTLQMASGTPSSNGNNNSLFSGVWLRYVNAHLVHVITSASNNNGGSGTRPNEVFHYWNYDPTTGTLQPSIPVGGVDAGATQTNGPSFAAVEPVTGGMGVLAYTTSTGSNGLGLSVYPLLDTTTTAPINPTVISPAGILSSNNTSATFGEYDGDYYWLASFTPQGGTSTPALWAGRTTATAPAANQVDMGSNYSFSGPLVPGSGGLVTFLSEGNGGPNPASARTLTVSATGISLSAPKAVSGAPFSSVLGTATSTTVGRSNVAIFDGTVNLQTFEISGTELAIGDVATVALGAVNVSELTKVPVSTDTTNFTILGTSHWVSLDRFVSIGPGFVLSDASANGPQPVPGLNLQMFKHDGTLLAQNIGTSKILYNNGSVVVSLDFAETEDADAFEIAYIEEQSQGNGINDTLKIARVRCQ